MNEQIKTRTAEEIRNDELVRDYLERHPVVAVEKIDNGEACEKALDSFESAYPVEELESIDGISLDDLMAHPVREPARKALTEIWKEMKKLESFNEELDARYVRIAKAVGVYDGVGKRLDHTRFNNYRG